MFKLALFLKVPTSSPDQMAPRVPTQSLPMVVPPHEPDQAPEFTSPPVCEHYNPSALFQLSSQLEGKLPQDADKSNRKSDVSSNLLCSSPSCQINLGIAARFLTA